MNIYLAGTACLAKHPYLLEESSYILESFAYVKPWQIEILKSRKGFILDSGAFTFMNGRNAGRIEEYAESYGKFVKENDVKHFVELDVDDIVGIERYKEVNERLEYIAGRKAMPVFHKRRGLEWWKKKTKENPYVCYGGVAVDIRAMKKMDFDAMPEMIKVAHCNGATVHGLGFTQTKKYDRIRFDSVDSTTWTMAGRMGIMCFFNGTRMQQFHSTEKGKKMVEPEKLMIFNYREWLKYQRYMEGK